MKCRAERCISARTNSLQKVNPTAAVFVCILYYTIYAQEQRPCDGEPTSRWTKHTHAHKHQLDAALPLCRPNADVSTPMHAGYPRTTATSTCNFSLYYAIPAKILAHKRHYQNRHSRQGKTAQTPTELSTARHSPVHATSAVAVYNHNRGLLPTPPHTQKSTRHRP